MKKIILLLSVVMMISCSDSFEDISYSSGSVSGTRKKVRTVEQVQQIAMNYLNAKVQFGGRRIKQNVPDKSKLKVEVLTQQMVNSINDGASMNAPRRTPSLIQDTVMFYVQTDSSAILVPAFPQAAPVLAEIEDPDFTWASILSTGSNFDNPLADLIMPALDQEYWDLFEPWTDWQGPFGEGLEIVERVLPKLKVEWDQYKPFNDHCPNFYPAGCVAIATAQAMTVTRNWNYINGLYLNYDNLVKLKNRYYSRRYESEADTIARLVRYIGDAIDTDYSSEASSAKTKDAIHKFFTPNMIVNTNASAVQSTLHKSRGIVIVSSRTKKNTLGFIPRGNGHAYNIDGYYKYNNEDSYVHVNFGWGPGKNGYFMKHIFSPRFVENAPDQFPYEMKFYCIYPNI